MTEYAKTAVCVFDSYDPETDRWKTLRPMKSARALAGCAVYRGKIYVIGGWLDISTVSYNIYAIWLQMHIRCGMVCCKVSIFVTRVITRCM